ncbi:DUF3558 domain-containing protein [Amycolatopsis jejuensis]|uniref:DUF3558 domain-containing protein n=1 Tax=Amycolatopsis jejuensis TaxID=330084 RepID=UPI000A019469|nr:DUF3558 domain-containing protein [Amycolatopsis jejuensis]
MRLRSVLSLTILSLTVAVVSACDGSASRRATPESPSRSLDTNSAPRVADPIMNTKPYESDPCSTVPTSTVESLGGKVTRTDVDTDSTGTSCAWIFSGNAGNINAGLVTGNKEGLSALYTGHRTGTLTKFQPYENVEGYPAVVYARGGEGQGTCNLAVGVRDNLTYTVVALLRTESPALSDPCGLAAKIAAAAVGTMKVT